MKTKALTEIQNAQFSLKKLPGICDEKYKLQDASNILFIDGKYHFWYARCPAEMTWNEVRTSTNNHQIVLATSTDGYQWENQAVVLPPAKPGVWYERSTHAPHVVPLEGKYYMFFTAFYGQYSLEGKTGEKHIGVAVADRPEGPFEVFDNPVLSPSDDPEASDHYLIDDACVIRRNKQFLLYYKGRNSIRSQCYLRLAVADKITGPYRKVEFKPEVDHDWHTACIWPYREGLAGIIDWNCLAYSEDGISFAVGVQIPEFMCDAGVFSRDALADVKYSDSDGSVWGIAQKKTDEKNLYRFNISIVNH